MAREPLSSTARKKIVYTITCLCLGILLGVIAAFLVIPSTSYSIPDYKTATDKQPRITVFTEQPDQPVLVLADFRNSKDYTIVFVPETLKQYEAGTTPDPRTTHVHLLILVTSQSAAFTWSNPYALTNVRLREGGDGALSSVPTGLNSGSGNSVYFTGTIGPDIPRIDFYSSESPWTENGPYHRFSLPSIDVPSLLYAGSSNFNPVNPNRPLMSVDGTKLYAPSLNTWVLAQAIEQQDSSLETVHIVPAPSDEVPLQWRQSDRFLVDMLYRDSNWDKQAAIKIFAGGLVSAIGVTVLLMPIALLASDGSSDGSSVAKTPITRTKRTKKQRGRA
jgi:hypothetical protein